MYRFFVSLLTPLPILCLLLAVGLIVLWRSRRASRGQLLWLAIPLVLLVLSTLPAVSYLALGSLEWAYPPEDGRPADAQAIVVLAGYVRPPNDLRPEAELGQDTYSRCLHAARLYRQGEPCLVVVSGGKVESDTPGPTLAEVMRDFLLTQGVAAKDILLEDKSSTTYENARETADLLSQRGIERVVLVTSATHMQRSERCLRARACRSRRRVATTRPRSSNGTCAPSCPTPMRPPTWTWLCMSGWAWAGTGCGDGFRGPSLARVVLSDPSLHHEKSPCSAERAISHARIIDTPQPPNYSSSLGLPIEPQASGSPYPKPQGIPR